MSGLRRQVLQAADNFGLHDSYRDLLDNGVRLFGEYQYNLESRPFLCLHSLRQGSEDRGRAEVLILDVDQLFGAFDGIYE